MIKRKEDAFEVAKQKLEEMVKDSLVIDEGVKNEVQPSKDNNFIDLAKERVVLTEFFRTKGS
jgi:hypothetical protein